MPNIVLLLIIFIPECPIVHLFALTDQSNDPLATALSEVTADGELVGQDEAGGGQVKDPLSALAAAAELDQVRSDVAAVSGRESAQSCHILCYIILCI